MSPDEQRGPAATGPPSSSSPDEDSSTADGTEQPGAVLLVNRLIAAGYSVQEVGRGRWKAQCPNPEHEDIHASLGIDVRCHRYTGAVTLLVNCIVCGAGLKQACEAAGIPQWKALTGNEPFLPQRPAKPAEPLSEKMVALYREVLLTRASSRLAYLREQRGLTLATIQHFELGYDEGFDRYVLPVRDAKGNLVNLRRYLPGAKTRKMVNATGHGSPRLYPLPLQSDWQTVLVTEGEWDALLARQHRLPACTGTHGAPTWAPQWSRWLTGRKVVFAFDCDMAGREAAAKHAPEVAKYAAGVRVIDLGLGDGEDLSDWFLKYGRTKADLGALIKRTPTFAAGGG